MIPIYQSIPFWWLLFMPCLKYPSLLKSMKGFLCRIFGKLYFLQSQLDIWFTSNRFVCVVWGSGQVSSKQIFICPGTIYWKHHRFLTVVQHQIYFTSCPLYIVHYLFILTMSQLLWLHPSNILKEYFLDYS